MTPRGTGAEARSSPFNVFRALSGAILIVAFWLLGCRTVAIPDLETPIPDYLTERQVEISILEALSCSPPTDECVLAFDKAKSPFDKATTNRGPMFEAWHFLRKDQGIIYGAKQVRNHYLEVSVRQAAHVVVIEIVDSRNLLQTEDGIHNAAIQWVNELLSSIAAALHSAVWKAQLLVVPPEQPGSTVNSAVVELSKNDTWAQLISGLTRMYFVVNNVERDSGFINVSYSGDPEPYVDCGNLSARVFSSSGEQRYDGPIARSEYSFPILVNRRTKMVQRDVRLEGRMNLVVGRAAPKRSRVTVNVRYIVTFTTVFEGEPTRSDVVSFSTGNKGSAGSFVCQATGTLESEVLAIVASGPSSARLDID